MDSCNLRAWPSPVSSNPKVALEPPTHRCALCFPLESIPLTPQSKGLFITEAPHPFDVLRSASFAVDLVSETGSYSPDWLSTTAQWLPEKDRMVYEDRGSEFRQKLDRMLRPQDVKWEDYDLFFASAGHASLIDYPDAKGLQEIASRLYEKGGIVSAV